MSVKIIKLFFLSLCYSEFQIPNSEFRIPYSEFRIPSFRLFQPTRLSCLPLRKYDAPITSIRRSYYVSSFHLPLTINSPRGRISGFNLTATRREKRTLLSSLLSLPRGHREPKRCNHLIKTLLFTCFPVSF